MPSQAWSRIARIEEVDPALVAAFSCGDKDMDGWFLSHASSWCYLGLCQVYVALDDEGVAGFFSLSPTSVSPESLSRGMKSGKNSMEHPGFLLGRIAVRSGLQRSQGVGTALLNHALKCAVDVSRAIGGRFIVLDAKSEALAVWYERCGFRRLKGGSLRLAMPMKAAASVVEELGEEYFLF